jgi:hypothetical protein
MNTVDNKMAMVDQLACLSTVLSQTHAEHDIIHPQFQCLQQVQAGQTTAMLRNREITTELSFENAINPTRTLLGAQLAGIIRFAFTAAALARSAMLPRGKATLFERAFR